MLISWLSLHSHMCKIWVHANCCMWYWSRINCVYWCTIGRLCSFDSLVLNISLESPLLWFVAKIKLSHWQAVSCRQVALCWNLESYWGEQISWEQSLDSKIYSSYRYQRNQSYRITDTYTHDDYHIPMRLAMHWAIIMWLMPNSYTAYDKGSNLKTRLFIKPSQQ